MKHCRSWLMPAVALAALTTGAQAQFGMTPQQMQAMQAKQRKWQTWRENHKQISSLMATLMGLGELDKDPKTRLNKSQAKKILSVLKTWRNKRVMTDDQARAVNKQITSPLTPGQLQKMATAPRFGQGGRGFGGGARPGGGGPGGGPGGSRPGGGRRAGFDPTKFPDPAEYNPLNPDSNPMVKMSPEMGQRVKTRFNDMIGKLETRSK